MKSKSHFSFNTYDWRSDIYIDNYARSVPSNPSNRVTLIDRDSFRPGSLEDVKKEGMREVELEGLINDGKAKREKRGESTYRYLCGGMRADGVATTATSLGFDFVPNPCITALPDTEVDNKTKPRNIAGTSSAAKEGALGLVATPQTPGLVRESAELEEEEDDEWERVSAFSTGQCLPPRGIKGDDMEDEGEVVVLGELELEDDFEVDATKSGPAPIKISYAAMLGKQA